MENKKKNTLRRRGFMGASAGLAGASMFRGLTVRKANADRAYGYGPLLPIPAFPDLRLPAGFTYTIISRYGDVMSDGYPTPLAMDGMGAFALPNGNVALIRNHEDRQNPNDLRTGGFLNSRLQTHYGPRIDAYDTYGGAGCTILEVQSHPPYGVVRDGWAILGTTVNCAGGVTPWGSWITCEETTASQGTATTGFAVKHGYCFNVPLTTLDDGPVTPVPLKFLGRFSHEAISVDPATNTIYETEDQGADRSGFYRWVPPVGFDPANINSVGVNDGTLQILRVKDPSNPANRIKNFNTGWSAGQVFACEWRTIPTSGTQLDLDPPPGAGPNPVTFNRDPSTVSFSGGSAMVRQGSAVGGTRFMRLEGTWYGNGKVYFQDTRGGAAQLGQVFAYDIAASTLTLLYTSSGIDDLDSPDNMCVSPSGGLVICEDGSGGTTGPGAGQFLRGIGPNGDYFDLARTTAVNDTEFAGACFSPDGQTLFVNQQGPTNLSKDGSGNVIEPIEVAWTLAIRGPWAAGPLG